MLERRTLTGTHEVPIKGATNTTPYTQNLYTLHPINSKAPKGLATIPIEGPSKRRLTRDNGPRIAP